MCRLFEVSKSNYYRWLKIENQEDYQLNELIKNVLKPMARVELKSD
jgi:hypothetical protein